MLEDDLRVATCNDGAVAPQGEFVLYWMIANRRLRYNYALERAVGWARELDKPLVVLEALRLGYRWASDRLHAFILEGMRDNRAQFAKHGVLYHPYVELEPGAGKGLLAALAARAALVVTDEFPCFFLPDMVQAAARQVQCRMEQVDSCGLLPLRAAPRVFLTAHSFRTYLHRSLPEHLSAYPRQNPVKRELRTLNGLPKALVRRWPAANDAVLAAESTELAKLPIDHHVARVPLPGGESAARRALRTFLDHKLARYDDECSKPQADATSRLSPYLHFGHISVHEIVAELMRHEGRALADLSAGSSGKAARGAARGSFWRASAPAEAFLDELVTWREIGFNMCHKRDDYADFASLPEWAKRTLAKHAADPRPHRYTLAELERAATHDDVWNAAQMQMVREGWFHNHMRMLWGKKILEWSPTPELALAAMIELMGKYSLDGRNPNSFTGFFWVLGRYDRPWGPERPIFGTVRYMSSTSLARKVPIREYVAAYAPKH